MTSMRIGHGFDVHPFSEDPNRVLVLGGVSFPGTPGLEGHSDGDAAAHAVLDALVSAAGLGDIGTFFPDTDPAHEGANSVELLRNAAAQVRSAGWQVMNVDCTLITDQPKIAPHRDTMNTNLSDAAGGPVTIKGKRTEGIDGLGGGIQCHAVALLSSHPTDATPATQFQRTNQAE